jgi:hypothetical protein
MADLTIGEAAVALGVGIHTVRQRIRSGELLARRDRRGRYLVIMPPGDMSRSRNGDASFDSAGAESRRENGGRFRLQPTRALLAEVYRQRDHLEAQIDIQRAQLEQAQSEQRELTRLLSAAQGQLELLRAMLANPSESEPRTAVADSTDDGQARLRGWTAFRNDKRDLGAGLTLTGTIAILAGIMLHFSLEAHTIATVVHLGYFFGLVGLLSLLIGLVLVF